MTLDEFNARFKWTKDGMIDSYRVLRGDGPLRGDCDDHAATVAYIDAGNWWAFWWGVWTFRYVFWFVRDPNGGAHIVLYVRGKGWIDNWTPAFHDKLQLHSKRWPVLPPVVVLKMLLGKLIG